MAVVSLTAAFVRSIRPPESGRAEYWDAATPGLCLRVGASGVASWSFRYRPRNGAGFQRVTLGPLSDLSLADARQRAARHRVDVADGADPQRTRKEQRAAAASVLTFDVLAARYVDEYGKPNKTSWRNDEGYLKRPREAWKGRPAASITRRDVIVLLDEIKAAAPVSANRTQSVLVGLFNWAVGGELLEVNPIAGLKKRAKEKPKDRTLSDAELALVWRWITSGSSGTTVDIAAALRLLLLTGQRPGEIAGLRRQEVVAVDNAKEARLELPADRMKGRRPHVVPLGPLAREIIIAALHRRSLEGESEGEIKAVFASKFHSREALARHSLSQALRRMLAGLSPEGLTGEEARAVATLKDQPPTPHDFRRTVATGLSRLGVPREDRLAVLAHADDGVHTKHYDRYQRLREKRAALGRWERHLAALTSDAPLSGNVLELKRGAR